MSSRWYLPRLPGAGSQSVRRSVRRSRYDRRCYAPTYTYTYLRSDIPPACALALSFFRSLIDVLTVGQADPRPNNRFDRSQASPVRSTVHSTWTTTSSTVLINPVSMAGERERTSRAGAAPAAPGRNLRHRSSSATSPHGSHSRLQPSTRPHLHRPPDEFDALVAMAHPSHPYHAQYLTRSRSSTRFNTHSASTTQERSRSQHNTRTHDRPRDPRRQRRRDAQLERGRASRERTSKSAGHSASGLVAAESHSEPSDPEGSAAVALAAALPAQSPSSLGTSDQQPTSRSTTSRTVPPTSRRQGTLTSEGSLKQQSAPTEQRERSSSASTSNPVPTAHLRFAPSPAPHRAARARAGTAPGRVSDSTLDKQELYTANTYFIPRTSSNAPTGSFGLSRTGQAPSASSIPSIPSTSTWFGSALSLPSAGSHASTGSGGKSKGQVEAKGTTQPQGVSSVRFDPLPAPTKQSRSFLGRLATSWKQRGRTSQWDAHAPAPPTSAAEQPTTSDVPAVPSGLTRHPSHPSRPRGSSLASSNSVFESRTAGSPEVIADAPSDEMEHMVDDVSPTPPGPITPVHLYPPTFGMGKGKGPSSPRIRIQTRDPSTYMMPSSSALHESKTGNGEDEGHPTSTLKTTNE